MAWAIAQQAPLSTGFPTGVGGRSLLQGLVTTQGSNQSVNYKAGCVCAGSLQSCLTLCSPMDSSPPGSSVHGISQARTLEWAAISSSRGAPDPGMQPASLCLLHWQADSLPLASLILRKKCRYMLAYLQAEFQAVEESRTSRQNMMGKGW